MSLGGPGRSFGGALGDLKTKVSSIKHRVGAFLNTVMPYVVIWIATPRDFRSRKTVLYIVLCKVRLFGWGPSGAAAAAVAAAIIS